MGYLMWYSALFFRCPRAGICQKILLVFWKIYYIKI